MDLFGHEAKKSNGLTVVVTGGRFFKDEAFVRESLDFFDRIHNINALFHGGAKGVDSFCGSWAWDHGIPMFECRANWKHYQKSAGPIRNHWMKIYSGASHLLAFPGKVGTAHMVAACEKHGMSIVKFNPEWK